MRIREGLASLLVVLWACAADPSVRHHVVMFDGDGEPVDPAHNALGLVMPYDEIGNEFDVYLEQHVVHGLEDWAASRADDEPRRVVVFVHGGLNTQRGSVERARVLSDEILADGAYPIFVNWQSSLWSSYRDHLLFIRRGNDFGWLGATLAPFYLLADVGRMVVRAPIVTFEGLWRTAQYLVPNATPEQRVTRRAAQSLVTRHEDRPDDPTAVDIYVGPDRSTAAEETWKATKLLVTLPARLVTTPFVDAMGTPAWTTMLRRIDLLVEREEDSHEGYTRHRHHSDLLDVFARLDAFVAARPDEAWEVDLIGHSMGTIVMNRVLAHAAHGCVEVPRFRNLVYMAPACSLRDFEDTVLPYLEQRREQDLVARGREADGEVRPWIDPSCRVSILTLALAAEIEEENAPEAFGLAPRGSLLLWIDDYFTQPGSEVDHTLGRFSDLIAFFHRVPEHLVAAFVIKAFDHGAGVADVAPQKHGDFGAFPFWKRAFWEPAGPDVALARRR